MRRMDKEKTTARNCQTGRTHQQSFLDLHKISINDIASGFNAFFHSHPPDYREEEHIEPQNI